MKPLKRKNYGSIPHLLGSKLGKTDKYVHEGQHRIMTEKLRDLNDYLWVTEKYDGSNVGITRVDNRLYAITRSGYLAETSPYIQHHYFKSWVDKHKYRFEFIKEGERLIGEWLLQVHSIKYEIENKPFIVFDYFDNTNTRLPYKEFIHKVISKFNIPRIIFCGKMAIDIETAMKILNDKPDPRFKTEKPEGLVYRIERNNKFDFAAKYVRPDYESGKYIIDAKEERWNMSPKRLP